VPEQLTVLFVQGTGERAGAEVALLGRLRHLPEMGIRPTVAFLEDGPFREEVERGGTATVLLRTEAPRARAAWRLPRVVSQIARHARGHGFDVVEACGEKMSLLVGVGARGAGPATVFNLQDAPLRDARAALIQVAGRLGRHDAVVVPSAWMAEQFARKLRYRPRVVPNGVVADDAPPAPADVAAATGWPADAVTVGLFGRLVGWKGAEVLVRAAAALRDEGADMRFLVVGGTLFGEEPQFPARLRDLIRDLGLEGHFHLAGHHAEPRALMAACDIVAHCSTRPEPFGVVVVEAMLLGRPVVATREGGPGEIVEDGEDGLLTPGGDAVALAVALRRLAGDPQLRARLGEAGRRRARERYTARAIAGPLAELYRGVARQGQRGRPGLTR
jgi:glycosyltransferase involved in cell wall biosynthesis